MPPEGDDTQGQETGTGVDLGQGSETQLQETQVEEPDYSLAGDFLSGIEDEEHRKLLEPYVKKWDAGVTRRFQDLHSRYRPYEELGELEQIQQAVQIARILDSNPEYVYQTLGRELGLLGQQGAGNFQQQNQQQQDYELDLSELGQEDIQQLLTPYLSPVQQQLQQQQQLLQTVAEFIVESRRAEQEAQEDEELENYLGLLKQEFGDFDEEYVLTKMAQGQSGEDAVKAFKQLTQQQVNQATKVLQGAPDVLTGGGVVGGEAPEPGKLSNDQVKNLVADLVAKSQAS